ncbi:MAG: ABC transporter ATP-binding protein [Methylotenera sp.]|uniref:ABC transporter ATP-binding protein n=1 Tax=Methylotenera sp. TaxID=2051956 RepID=UPI002721FE8E|nr:ABC transporter ATP-binding protein [Methylotenera sp.]MDO9150042.1 ABC transporter ATP-binding protein [Methylotenera sp.]
MQKSVIEVSSLYKDYQTAAGPFPVLKDVNLHIENGDYVAIMGPSGSGKSTFMNILGCLDKPSKGQYVLDGHPVANMEQNAVAQVRNKTIGFVFQGFNLLARSSLLDNVALPLVYAGVDKAERHARAKLLLEKVGLANYLNSRPNQISGGQQQRVAIARALVNKPSLILADEPTGNLDSVTSEEIMTLFSELNQEGITIVLVTHETDIAEHASRQVRFLDGRIVQDTRTREIGTSNTSSKSIAIPISEAI